MRSGPIRSALGSLVLVTAAIFPILLLAAPASAARRSTSRATKAIGGHAPRAAPARPPGRKGQAVSAHAAPGAPAAPAASTGRGGLSSTEKLLIGGAILIAGSLLVREITDF
jgi:hypothetical protein